MLNPDLLARLALNRGLQKRAFSPMTPEAQQAAQGGGQPPANGGGQPPAQGGGQPPPQGGPQIPPEVMQVLMQPQVQQALKAQGITVDPQQGPVDQNGQPVGPDQVMPIVQQAMGQGGGQPPQGGQPPAQGGSPVPPEVMQVLMQPQVQQALQAAGITVDPQKGPVDAQGNPVGPDQVMPIVQQAMGQGGGQPPPEGGQGGPMPTPAGGSVTMSTDQLRQMVAEIMEEGGKSRDGQNQRISNSDIMDRLDKLEGLIGQLAGGSPQGQSPGPMDLAEAVGATGPASPRSSPQQKQAASGRGNRVFQMMRNMRESK